MRKLFKKAIAGVLSFVMVISMFMLPSVSAGALFVGEWFEKNGFSYEVTSDNTVAVRDYFGNKKSIVIPSSVKGYKVTGLDWTWNQSVEKLKTVSIPYTIKKIGDSVFPNCSSLEKIEVDSNNKKFSSKDGVLFNKNKTIILAYPQNKRNTSYKIPNSVKRIKERSFFGQNYLKKVTITKKVDTIGSRAFLHCPKIKSVKIPKTVEKIGSYALGYTYSMGGNAKIKGFVIKGYKGTAAEKYATKNNIKFIKL